jgi:CysZ protein
MIKNILKGIQAYGGSFRLISKLRLWKYFVVPMAISFLTAIGIGFMAWGLSDNLGNFISRVWFWEWGAEVFQAFSTFLATLIIIALGLILYKHIVMALSAPFMSPVSEKIETYLIGSGHTHRNTSNAAQLWRGIRINIRNLLMELLLSIPVLLLSLIPVVNVFTSFLLFLIQSYYAGFGNMDYTLERHYNVKESVRFVKNNRGIAIGNGMVFMLVLLIPVLGIILVLPLSVTAASTETVRILKAQEENKKATPLIKIV